MQQEYIHTTNEAIKEVGSIISEGKSKLKEQKEKDLTRRNEIATEAIEAVTGKKILSQAEEKEKASNKLSFENINEFMQNNKVKQLVISPQGSFNFMIKYIDVNHPMGEGPMYTRFMKSEDSVFAANDNLHNGEKEFRNEIKEKAEAIYGIPFEKVIEHSRKVSRVSLSYMDANGETHDSKMTYGELMYIHMIAKQQSGLQKLEKMGIDSDALDRIAEELGDAYTSMAEWIQKEFLPNKRLKYNDTHKRLFGTYMAKVENYFPLKYNTKDLDQKGDISNKNEGNYMPSTMTGSIINRVRNTKQIDISANAFDVLMQNGREMEEWNAYASVRKDLNSLLNNKYIKNLIDANDKLAYQKLKEAAVIATRAYREDPNASHAIADINRYFASSVIAFRVNTALKQTLSYPAFLEYSSNPLFLASLVRNMSPDTWRGNFKWALENLPGFSQRWEQGNVGMEKLVVDQWERTEREKTGVEKALDAYIRVGLFPNRLVDGMTISAGARTIYDYAYKGYIKSGLSEAEAHRKAQFEAGVAYNETQQSSRPEFLSPIQKKKDVWNRGITTFTNSPFSYMRKFAEGVDELFRKAGPQIQSITMENIRKGMTKEEAKSEATRQVLKGKLKGGKNALLYGFFIQLVWTQAQNLLYGLWDDDDDKEKDLLKATVQSPISGLYMGGVINSAIDGYEAGNPLIMFTEGEKRWNSIKKAYVDEGLFSPAIGLEAAKAMLQAGGINYETWLSMYKAAELAVENGEWTAVNTHYLLNTPPSIRKGYASKIKEGEAIEDYVKRIGDAYNRELKKS